MSLTSTSVSPCLQSGANSFFFPCGTPQPISTHSVHFPFHHKPTTPRNKVSNSRKRKIVTTTICCSAKTENGFGVVKERSVSVILLAGGKGKRMDAKEKINVVLKFALPGKEGQDSVYNGLQEVDLNSELVCIHDSARPLVLSIDVEKVLKDGSKIGVAVLGVPVKATIKEADGESFVVRTLDRKTLWEMHTPQVIKPELLKKGFEVVKREGLEVTDDVSIVEYLKHPVYITEGSYTNIKLLNWICSKNKIMLVTTPDDLLLAERILSLNSKNSPQ